MATTKSEAEALLPEFQYERTLNQGTVNYNSSGRPTVEIT